MKYEIDSGSTGVDSSRGSNSSNGSLTIIEKGLEFPPPGAGFVIEIGTEPAIVKSPDGIVATSSVAETYVLATTAEFALTVEPGRKLEPVIWTCVSGDASGTVEGDTETIDGVRFLIESVSEFDVPPPGVGFDTVIVWLPAMVSLAAGSTALSWLDETRLAVKRFPSKLTVDALLNPDPVRVSVVSADPTGALAGETLLREGAA